MSTALERPSVRSFTWREITAVIVAAVAFVYLVWPVLLQWVADYTRANSYYSHAPMLPCLIGLMFWHKRESLRTITLRPTFAMAAVLAPSLLLLIFATREESDSLGSIGLLLVIWSSVWLACGTDFVRTVAFPLAYIASMAPLPGILLTDGTQFLQALSTDVATRLLNITSLHAQHFSNVIILRHYEMAIDAPCSGFKLLLSMTALGAAFAYLVDGVFWKRALIFAFSVPLSLFINAVRIASIGAVGECVGASAAHSFHDWSGILTLWLAPIAFLLMAKGFGCRTLAGWRLF
ncbi:MAG: exosortase/archaeosortase family protein [Capsulimonadaceae bacterium]